MVRSWFRKWVNRKSRKAATASPPARRAARHWSPLALERLEDLTLLDGGGASAAQLFILSRASQSLKMLIIKRITAHMETVNLQR
jgi:hypothetical protein